jgi:hypothetical protein
MKLTRTSFSDSELTTTTSCYPILQWEFVFLRLSTLFKDIFVCVCVCVCMCMWMNTTHTTTYIVQSVSIQSFVPLIDQTNRLYQSEIAKFIFCTLSINWVELSWVEFCKGCTKNNKRRTLTNEDVRTWQGYLKLNEFRFKNKSKERKREWSDLHSRSHCS